VTVLVTGGTGFVGPKVIHALRTRSREVRALVRDPARASQLVSYGAEVVRGDVTRPADLREALRGCTQVVHLVSIIKGRPADFERVMIQGTANLVAAAKQEGIQRFVLMSALGTSEQSARTIPYYAAKWAMERDVSGSGLEYTIFRPSFVFGRGGGALPTFIRQVRLSPLVPVLGPGLQRSQPIWVDDVAAYLAEGVGDRQAANRLFELGGPDRVDWNELYRRIARVLGKRRLLVHVPFPLARAGARATERLPGAPISADQVAMLQGDDNVVEDTAAVETFGLPLVPLDEQIRRTA
jgi:uncharacterized protein YbjT (DUF2867 family)